jgi:hypothetical protein
VIYTGRALKQMSDSHGAVRDDFDAAALTGTAWRLVLLMCMGEFRRALAAERQYEDMKYRAAPSGRRSPDEIARGVFEDCYSNGR